MTKKKIDTMLFFLDCEINNRYFATGFRMSCVEGYHHHQDGSTIEVYLTSGRVLKIPSHYSNAFFKAMDSFFNRIDLDEYQEDEEKDTDDVYPGEDF